MTRSAEPSRRRRVRGVRSAAGFAIGAATSALMHPLQLRQYVPRALHLHQGPVDWVGPWPSIGVAMPTLNQGMFIEESLRSVLDQHYPDLQVVVQDGGSTDGTAEVLGRFSGERTIIVSEPDAGQGDAINRAFARTTADVLAWLNSDDLLLPGALAAVGSYFAQHLDTDVVYGWRIVIDASGQEVGRWTLPPTTERYLRWADYIPQETLFWRRRLWDRVGAEVDVRHGFALDWDLLLRFQTAGARFACIPRYLGAFRVHADSKTVRQLDRAGAEEMARLRRAQHGRDVGGREVARALLPLYARTWAVRAREAARR